LFALVSRRSPVSSILPSVALGEIDTSRRVCLALNTNPRNYRSGSCSGRAAVPSLVDAGG